MKVKVLQEFLGVSRGTIGEVFNLAQTGSVVGRSMEIQFPCKDEPVLVGWPNSHLMEHME